MPSELNSNVIEKALRERPWMRKVGPNRHRVTPRTENHGKYELSYYFEDGLPVVESCVDVRTKEECRGFRFHGRCYHATSLILHLLRRKAA